MPLSQLPPEIFEIVADNLDPEDLLATRLACRDLAAKSMRNFTQVHFSEKRFLLSSVASLVAAIDIARHPVFGPVLRKVSFYIDTVKRPQSLGIPGGFGDGGPWDQFEAHGVLHNACSEFTSSTQLNFLGNTYNLASCIGTLLSALARLNRVEELVVTDCRASAAPPTGARISKRMWALGMMELGEMFGSFAACLIDQAVSFLHWPALQAFSVKGSGWALNPRGVVGPAIRATRTGGMLACATTHQLRRVTLDLQSVVTAEPNIDMRLIFSSLQQDWALEYLDLRMSPVVVDGFDSYDSIAPQILFGDPAAPATYVCLKELKLTGAGIGVSRTRSFLKRQPAIQKLSLDDSCLDLEGGRFQDMVEDGDECECQTLSRILGIPTTMGALTAL